MATTDRSDVVYTVVDVGTFVSEMEAELFRMAERGYEFVQAIPITIAGSTTGYRVVFQRRNRATPVNPSSGQ